MIKAKKSLGQNFLKDTEVIQHILSVAELGLGDKIFEIGPGMGALTEHLASLAHQVIALELDHGLVVRLQQHFEESKGVSILEGNILETNVNDLLTQSGFQSGGYKVIANIPYYITAPILRILLSLQIEPQSLTLMVQKEVAERIVAPPGKMSLLSLMVQYYSRVTLAFTVPATAFDPAPKVESAVIYLVPFRSFDLERDRQIFRLARIGFATRRKTLANNLAAGLGRERTEMEALLSSLHLRCDIRAQALSVTDWERLSVAVLSAKV